MREMSLREFRQVMGVIDEVLAAHGELTITRHGRPIAKVVPLPGERPVPSRAALRADAPRAAPPGEAVGSTRACLPEPTP
jgi:prevent-host-death family protein